MDWHELAEIYRQRRPEGHWFDADTMRFFKSRVGLILERRGCYWFITSERPPSGGRRFSVRYMGQDGRIETLGPFCELTRYKAGKLLDIAYNHGWTEPDHVNMDLI